MTGFCEETVYDGMIRGICSKRAKVVVNGRRYCGIHDPAAVAARRSKVDVRASAKAAVWEAEGKMANLRKKAADWAFDHPDADDLRVTRNRLQQELVEAQTKLAAVVGNG